MEQVAELVAPHPNTLALVTSWLEHNGLPTSSISRTLAGGWLTVTDVPVSQANELLGASYQLYYHAGMNDTILRTAGYALPRELHVHVKTVIPTTAFTSTRFLQQTSGHHSGEAAAPNMTSEEPVNMLSRRQGEDILPSVLRSMYHTATYYPRPDLTNNRIGLVGYDDESPNLEDLKSFMHDFRSDGIDQIVDIKTIDRNVPVGRHSGRANMFTQYAGAMAFPIPITFYNGTGRPKYRKNPKPGQTDVVLQWLHYTLGRQDIPQTIGLMTDGTKERSIGSDYAQTVCDQFKILGVTGVTVFVASGDDGVGAGQCAEFYINFPASCTCSFYCLLPSCTQAQVPVAHRTVILSQVPMSLLSAERREYHPQPKSRTPCLGVASLITFRPWTSRNSRWATTSTISRASTKAATRSFSPFA